jgi:mono/diheme cytochrome c family protein
MISVKSLILSTILLGALLLAVAACSQPTPEAQVEPYPPAATTPPETQPTSAMGTARNDHAQHGQSQGLGKGKGIGGPPQGMRERHQAPIPAAYQNMTNPVPADEASLARGEAIYAQQCASCHGDGGMGDGPAGQGMDPAPAPIAHSSQMLGDSYLFWRIQEGGAPFNTGMPAFNETLSEEEVWDVINYVRALGSGEVKPRRNMGGQAMNPEAEAQMHAEMLATGVEQGVITQEEADLFTEVHDQLNAYKETHMEELRSFMGSPEAMQKAMLDALVQSGEITQAQAEAFADIHDRLVEAGIMQ